MVRRTFFSFHYERDIWRASVVRNSWVTKDREYAGFWDASLWEDAKLKGDIALKNLINNGLKNTSVTVVLIGKDTSKRKWVRYEIEQSYNKGKGLMGIYIHNIKDRNENTDFKGENPFNIFSIDKGGSKTYFSDLYSTYDWKIDRGYNNIGKWIELAAQKAGR